ncbi:MAG TPA: amino acid adenylation domain-containing protein, partial [Blastocatellia bacterium]|nr:amino acid adenylation domain-containing protein [Blastocatellia bacterium]
AAEEASRGFDLREGPLIRGKLLRLGEEDHVLLLTMHHIISDGWSVGVFVRELGLLYPAFLRGEPSPLEDLPIQYADYAVWQRSWLQGAELRRQIDYWKGRLSGPLPPLELPWDRPRPAVKTYSGRVQSRWLSESLSRSLKELSRREGATLFMTLLAAFNVLLFRYSGQEDILVGTPIANRNRAEIEGLIGFFINTLVMRSDLSGNPTFRELVGRVKNTALEAYDHQDVPFETLVQELQPDRDPSRTPIFQVVFILQNAPDNGLQLPGLNISLITSDSGTAKFDLTLGMIEAGERLFASMEYNTDLFDDETISRMLSHFQAIIEAVAADPETRIAELPLLSDDEMNRMLVEWNETGLRIDPNRLLHELVEEQAEQTPERVAVISRGEQISYVELNERANQLGHYLRSRGVGPEVRVGLCIERGVNMVVGLLGILKAGGAYVPLDPAYPAHRLRYVIEDADVRLIVTDSRLKDSLPADQVEVILIDRQWEQVSRESRQRVGIGVVSENLAYLIYTSGTTGRPKGVAIEHRSAAAFIQWAREEFEDRFLAGVLASTSLCFDLSVFEIFAPLSRGGKVIVAENALALADIEERNEVSLINTVPSAMAELVRLEAIPESVKAVNLAGEALQRRLVEEIYDQSSVEVVRNLYGPSEDTTYSTYERIERGADVTIGRPVAGSQVYVLDERMQPVPVGVLGEIYISGAGLARGYLNRPDLTADRFVADPFSKAAGGRLYKTGDVARYRSDGRIEYIGRKDHQVKVRGYRIEPGEIEAVLTEHPGVRKAVVVVREDEIGDRRLVGYVVSREGEEAELEELRSHLKERLPEYMVPGAIVLLDELPLTANGKLDRNALPAPEGTATKADGEFVAPRNIIEDVIASIWKEVLGVEKVSINDNFFEVGGHSLLATQVVSRLREGFRTQIPLRTFFAGPTVAELAQALIAEEKKPGRVEKLARLLDKVRNLSPEELGRMLEEKERGAA